jgi:hypothetical protein
MTFAIFFLLAFQAGTAHPDSLPVFAAESQQEENPASEEQEFMQRLNGLSKALNNLAATYKSGEVDLRKVKAVQKAMHELENSDSFRPQKKK